MTAVVIKLYQAYCEECDWESGPDDSEFYAEMDAERHNEFHEEEEALKAEESYQETLDRLLREIREQ